jgi:dTDP-4-dehydrorhamnose 3,5-epimerase
MHLEQTPLAGVFEAQTEVRRDDRGRFARLFCAADLAHAHVARPIVQINHSQTRAVGAIRGLHYQWPPAAEGKWVRCLKGRVFDVAVDLRRGSPTFLRWHGVELNSARMNAIFIPEGCAHGFQVLEADSELLYLHTAAYIPALEGAVRFDDPRVDIAWPLSVTEISERDRSHPLLDDAFEGIVVQMDPGPAPFNDIGKS